MPRAWKPPLAGLFQTTFPRQLDAIFDTLEKRLLPNFGDDTINEESQRIVEGFWDRFTAIPGMEERDPDHFLDAAHDAGISHYLLMYGIRQGMISLFAAALYHTFEQQLMFVHRKNVLLKNEENEPNLYKIKLFCSRLKEYGIDIEGFPSWQKIEELRLVTNTVKHAVGNSSRKLRKIRPDLFRNPLLPQESSLLDLPYTQLAGTLVGEGLYVSLQDVKDYRDHLVLFWEELANVVYDV